MRLYRVSTGSSCQSGISLIETAVALFVLGVIAVTFLAGVSTTSRAALITDEQATADSLARAQMEWVQNSSYTPGATQYAAGPIPTDGSYDGYSVAITAAPLYNPDNGIQKITVTVTRSGKRIITLESYKADRD